MMWPKLPLLFLFVMYWVMYRRSNAYTCTCICIYMYMHMHIHVHNYYIYEHTYAVESKSQRQLSWRVSTRMQSSTSFSNWRIFASFLVQIFSSWCDPESRPAGDSPERERLGEREWERERKKKKARVHKLFQKPSIPLNRACRRKMKTHKLESRDFDHVRSNRRRRGTLSSRVHILKGCSLWCL